MRRRSRENPVPDRLLRIVVADDDAAFRRLLGQTLRQDGHEVVEARDGAELLRCLSEPPLAAPMSPAADLVITDICMPGLSGLEALAALEHADCLPPFIVMTAFGSSERDEQARALGAAAVFEKPFSIERLRRTVIRYAQAQ
ncbi:MAG: response regulator [Polyangiaceae bacterium]|nr:response regulator [Polyangiaceae bacterium]